MGWKLVDSGLVRKGDDYEVKLSASSLVVNGKTQPAAVHEKIKSFYESTFGRRLDAEEPITIVQGKE